MQAIEVKFYPVTNTRPSRFVAQTASGIKLSRSASMLDGRDAEAQAIEVARQLVDMLKWSGDWAIGKTKTAWVCVCFRERSQGFACFRGD